MYNDVKTDITIENLYLMHIMQIGILSTNIHFTAKAEWQVNARNYTSAVNTLEAMAQGDIYSDKKYQKRLDRLTIKAQRALAKFKTEKTENKVRQNDFEMAVSFEYSLQKLGLIMKSLIDNGKIRNRTVSAVDDLPRGIVNSPDSILQNTYQRHANQIRTIVDELLDQGIIPNAISEATGIRILPTPTEDLPSQFFPGDEPEFDNEEVD